MIIKNDYTLRRVDCGDFWRLWELNQKEKLFVFYGFDENCSYIELVQEFEKRCVNFADFVIEKPNGSLLGVCSYCHICWRGRTCEVDFKVYEDTSPFTSSIDAFKELLKFLRAELNLIRVYSFVPEYLVKETKVYEAAGLFRDGTLRQRIYHKGNYSDLLVYGSML